VFSAMASFSAILQPSRSLAQSRRCKTPCWMEIRGANFIYVVLLDERAQPTRLYPLLAVAAVPLVACVSTNAAAGGEHTNVFVNCFCSDVVGGELCTTLKRKVGALSDYRLADKPFGAGVGVHLVCRDTGAEVKGAQSAVSVAYTVYLDGPNEVFVALAVMLVGAHRVEPTAAAIASTVRRIASDNASILRPPRSGGGHN
jgi:hypothetical protein